MICRYQHDNSGSHLPVRDSEFTGSSISHQGSTQQRRPSYTSDNFLTRSSHPSSPHFNRDLSATHGLITLTLGSIPHLLVLASLPGERQSRYRPTDEYWPLLRNTDTRCCVRISKPLIAVRTERAAETRPHGPPPAVSDRLSLEYPVGCLKTTVEQQRRSWCFSRTSLNPDVADPCSPTISASFTCAVTQSRCSCHLQTPSPIPTSATAIIEPNHYELAAASFYAGVSDETRREKVVPGGVPLAEVDVVNHRATGLRVALFTGREYIQLQGQRCSLCGGSKPSLRVQAAVLAFRGTSLGNRGHLLADWGILKHDHRSQELQIADEAHAVVLELMTKLREAAEPEVQFVWFATGHSLGAFLATTTTIRAPEIHACVTFEAPGCPRLYRELAEQRGGVDYWREKLTSYLSLPSAINMQHQHLGRVVRVELDYVSRVHALHVLKSISGTLFRWVNWVLLLLILLLATEVVSGVFVLVSVTYLARLVGRLGFLQLTLLGVRCLVSIKYKLEAHKLSNMIPMFCANTGRPKECVEMAVWPASRDIKRTNSWAGLIWHALVPTHTGDSIMHLFTQRHLITNQMVGLPGYQEMSGGEDNQSTPSSSPDSKKQLPLLPV